MGNILVMLKKISLSFLFLMVASLFQTGVAQERKLLGKYKDWVAYSYIKKGKKVCYMASKPISSEGKYSSRGPVWFLVTHKPAENEKGVISFISGYRFKPKCDNSNKKECQVNAMIGREKYLMYTEKDVAWNYPGGDKKMVSDLIRGSSMTINGKSHRGTDTKDVFSLLGFTAAYREISRKCSQ